MVFSGALSKDNSSCLVLRKTVIHSYNKCDKHLWKIVRGKSDAHFVSAKRLFRDLSESNSNLVEHRAQSPVLEFRLAVWPSSAEEFPAARSRANLYNKCDKYLWKKSLFPGVWSVLSIAHRGVKQWVSHIQFLAVIFRFFQMHKFTILLQSITRFMWSKYPVSHNVSPRYPSVSRCLLPKYCPYWRHLLGLINS